MEHFWSTRFYFKSKSELTKWVIAGAEHLVHRLTCNCLKMILIINYRGGSRISKGGVDGSIFDLDEKYHFFLTFHHPTNLVTSSLFTGWESLNSHSRTNTFGFGGRRRSCSKNINKLESVDTSWNRVVNAPKLHENKNWWWNFSCVCTISLNFEIYFLEFT